MHLTQVRQRRPASVLADVVTDFMAGKPINREATIGAVEEMFAQWAQNIGAGYRPDIRPGETESSAHRRAQAGQSSHPWWQGFDPWSGQGPAGRPDPHRPPPPPVDPEEARQAVACAAARRVMGFTDKEKLDEDMIKRRHRELSKRYHPDRGGSTEKMAAVNNAADVLRASL